VKLAVPKTKVTGGKKTMKEYEKDSDSDSDSESDTKSDKKTPVSNTKKKFPKLVPSSRKTKKKRDTDEPPETEEIEETDGEVEIRSPFELNKGAIELRKEKEIELSDEVKDQIEREIFMERNAVGEDKYHSGGATTVTAVGGAPIVDNHYSGIRLDEQGNLSDIDFERKIKEILI
jgi:hypothetical protein